MGCNLGWNHVILKLKSQVWFQTKIAQHEVQLPLYYIHFEITQILGLGQFKYFIDPVLSPFKIKFIHFWGKKIRVLVGKFATWYPVFHFLTIWLLTLKNLWNLIGCFVFSVASSLARKKMPFKAKNGVIHK